HPIGLVFLDCKRPGGDATYLGRPWRPWAAVAYIHCELGPLIKPAGWDNWRDPAREKTARFAEYQSIGPGANPNARVQWSHQLTPDEAAKYTLQNIFAGSDRWTPQRVSTTQPVESRAAFDYFFFALENAEHESTRIHTNLHECKEDYSYPFEVIFYSCLFVKIRVNSCSAF